MSSMTRIALALLVTFLGTGCSVSRTQPVARAATPPARHVLPNGVRGWDYPERYARALEAVSVLDVTRVARRYLANRTTVVVRPPS